MTEQERRSIFHAIVARAPGKRQVKPTAALFEEHAHIMPGSSDESDAEYVVHDDDAQDVDTDNESQEDEGNSSDGDESDVFMESGKIGDEEEEDPMQTGDEDKKFNDESAAEVSKSSTLPRMRTRHSSHASPKEPNVSPKKSLKKHQTDNFQKAEETKDPPKLICSVCLNLRTGLFDCEVIQCDNCGLSVHEACYAADEASPMDSVVDSNLPAQKAKKTDDFDTSSIISTESTEPWFALFGGHIESPHCELCPSRYGAFKRTDVGGSWVHLVCALYTPGITFADVDHLTGVSLQELDYRGFGRKQCLGCTDPLESRTGVAVECEAGLCKNQYHVTCAKRLGLLVDNVDVINHLPVANSSTASSSNLISSKNSHHQDSKQHAPLISTNFLLCKRHNHETDQVRRGKEAFILFVRQEERRMSDFCRVTLNERQERKRREQLERYMKHMSVFENTIVVLPTIPRTRMLHTNAHILNEFAKKAEQLGVERERFGEAFHQIPGEFLPLGLVPAFSHQFVSYVNYRDSTGAQEDREYLEQLNREHTELIAEKARLNEQIKHARAELPLAQQRSRETKLLLERFVKTLTPLLSPAKAQKLKNSVQQVFVKEIQTDSEGIDNNNKTTLVTTVVTSPSSSSKKKQQQPPQQQQLLKTTHNNSFSFSASSTSSSNPSSSSQKSANATAKVPMGKPPFHQQHQLSNNPTALVEFYHLQELNESHLSSTPSLAAVVEKNQQQQSLSSVQQQQQKGFQSRSNATLSLTQAMQAHLDAKKSKKNLLKKVPISQSKSGDKGIVEDNVVTVASKFNVSTTKRKKNGDTLVSGSKPVITDNDQNPQVYGAAKKNRQDGNITYLKAVSPRQPTNIVSKRVSLSTNATNRSTTIANKAGANLMNLIQRRLPTLMMDNSNRAQAAATAKHQLHLSTNSAATSSSADVRFFMSRRSNSNAASTSPRQFQQQHQLQNSNFTPTSSIVTNGSVDRSSLMLLPKRKQAVNNYNHFQQQQQVRRAAIQTSASTSTLLIRHQNHVQRGGVIDQGGVHAMVGQSSPKALSLPSHSPVAAANRVRAAAPVSGTPPGSSTLWMTTNNHHRNSSGGSERIVMATTNASHSNNAVRQLSASAVITKTPPTLQSPLQQNRMLTPLTTAKSLPDGTQFDDTSDGTGWINWAKMQPPPPKKNGPNSTTGFSVVSDELFESPSGELAKKRRKVN